MRLNKRSLTALLCIARVVPPSPSPTLLALRRRMTMRTLTPTWRFRRLRAINCNKRRQKLSSKSKMQLTSWKYSKKERSLQSLIEQLRKGLRLLIGLLTHKK